MRCCPNFKVVALKKLYYTFIASREFCEQNNVKAITSKEQLTKLPLIVQGMTHNPIKDLQEKLGIKLNTSVSSATTELMCGMVLRHMGIGYCLEKYLKGNEQIIKLKTNLELPYADLVFIRNDESMNKAMNVFLQGLYDACKKD